MKQYFFLYLLCFPNLENSMTRGESTEQSSLQVSQIYPSGTPWALACNDLSINYLYKAKANSNPKESVQPFAKVFFITIFSKMFFDQNSLSHVVLGPLPMAQNTQIQPPTLQTKDSVTKNTILIQVIYLSLQLKAKWAYCHYL